MSAAIRAQTKSNAATHNLWQIAGTGDVGQLEQVLARGADVNASDRSGMTALMRAAYHGQLQMVRALIEHGANLNAMDRDGLTALMLARHSGREDIVTTLVSCGVEGAPNARVSESSAVRAAQEETFDALSDPDVTRPSRDPKVRTLHDPPEIWDLVHETPAEFNRGSTLAGHFTSAKSLGLAVIALIIGGGALIGFMSLRGSSSATDATPVRREDTKSRTTSSAKVPEPQAAPASSDQQPSAKPAKTDSADSTKFTEPKRTASSSDQQPKITPLGDVRGVRTVDPNIPVGAPVALSVKQFVTKPRRKNPTSSTAAGSATAARSDNEISAGKPTSQPPQSDSDKSANSTATKKEPDKGQSQPLIAPAKASPAPKPKVIQWP